MRLRSAALGTLACLVLTFAAAAQEPAATPPPAQVELTAEGEGDLSAYTGRLHKHLSSYAVASIAGVTDSGEVRVRFRIRRDGEAQKPVLSLSSSKPALDAAALKAAADALAHVEPLPADVTRSFVDFQARFIFNQAEPPKQEATSLADLARQRSKRSADGEKKVFTNDEVSTASEPEPDAPRKGSASKTSSASSTEKSSTSSKSADGKSEKLPEQDPEHYRQRLQPLREQLSEVKNEINRVRYATPERTAGMATISNTQQNELERLQRKQSDLERRIAAICEEASRNNVSVSSCYYY